MSCHLDHHHEGGKDLSVRQHLVGLAQVRLPPGFRLIDLDAEAVCGTARVVPDAIGEIRMIEPDAGVEVCDQNTRAVVAGLPRLGGVDPVEAPDGAQALPQAPDSRYTSASTVGLPRESITSRPIILLIFDIIISPLLR